MVNFADSLLAETAALEANRIQSVGMGVAGRRSLGKGKHVARDGGPTSDIGMGSDANVLMYGAKRAHHRPFFYGHVAAQGCGVGQDDVIADYAIVSHMSVGHDERLIADARQAAAFCGAAIDGDKLPDTVVVADLKAGRLAAVTQILRRQSDGGEREEAVAGANFRRAGDSNVGDQLAIFAQLSISANRAIGADFAGGVNLRARIEDCGGVDGHRQWCLACGGTAASAVLSSAARQSLDPREKLGLRLRTAEGGCLPMISRRFGWFGWFSSTPPASAIHQLAGDSGLGYALAVNESNAFHAHGNTARPGMPGLYFHLDPHLVARNHWTAETRLFDAGKDHQLFASVFHFGEQQRSSGLGDGLDDQYSRHDGKVGKVPGKERLVDGDVLDGHDSLPAGQINDAVNEQEGIPMRQDFQDIVNVELDMLCRGNFRWGLRYLCHPGLVRRLYFIARANTPLKVIDR